MFDNQDVTAAILLQISLDHKKGIKEVIQEYNSTLSELLRNYPKNDRKAEFEKDVLRNLQKNLPPFGIQT